MGYSLWGCRKVRYDLATKQPPPPKWKTKRRQVARSMAELGPRQHGSEPAPVSSTPFDPMQRDMGAGTEFGVSTRRSFSLTLPHLPPGGGGKRGDPL